MKEGAQPHLIVSDMHMPGGNVLDLLSALRGSEREAGQPKVPVIVLTGEGREAMRREALLNGASLVLGKPVDPLVLLEEVRALSELVSGRQQVR